MAPLSKELPGFYYDAEKNRYFPLARSRSASQQRTPGVSPSQSSAPAAPSSGALLGRSSGAPSRRKRRHLSDPSRFSQTPGDPGLKEGEGASNVAPNRIIRMSMLHPSFKSRQRYHHAYIAQQFATTSAHPDVENISLGCPISSFAIDSSDPHLQILGTGDGSIWSGWNHWSSDRDTNPGNSTPHESRWKRESGLMSKITSTSISNGVIFATSFGPHPKVLICKVPDFSLYTGGELEERVYIYPWDIWAGLFVGKGFALGMSQHLWMVPDLDSPFPRPHKTHTDIISLAQQDSLIYAGGRNGTIFQYDKRVPYQKGTELLKARTSVTNIQPLRSWELLMTAINGDMNIYDVRALRKSQSATYNPPCIVRLHGHNSSRSLALPIAVDSSHDFVLAAGEDRVIRAWSTRTGERLQSPPSCSKVLNKQFEEDIVGMHISDSISHPSPSLWLAHGQTVERWDLGRQYATQ